MGHLGTVLAAHDIAAVLAFVAVLLPRLFVLFALLVLVNHRGYCMVPVPTVLLCTSAFTLGLADRCGLLL